MAVIEGIEYPERLYYDMPNQIWYEPLDDGTVRAGYTPFAIRLMGDVLAFTPKRVGRDFKAGRSFATIEGGKWVSAVEAAFDGTVIAANEELERRPKLINRDAFGQRLDADRAPRGRWLAQWPRHRAGGWAEICGVDRNRSAKGRCRSLMTPMSPFAREGTGGWPPGPHE